MRYKKKSNSIRYNEHASYLLIVESPSKCKKIENYLGINYACIASVGHLQRLTGLKSIDVKNNYNPTFTIIPEKKGHINEMKRIIEKFSKNNIYLASDDDREGEAIAWHICNLFNLNISTTKRIIFHEITKPAIINAVKNPITINMNLVNAQLSRQILDMIVGFKISPFLWKYLYNYKENSLSAGRCQTPALRLIYDSSQKNDKKYEIKYKLSGVFTNKKLIFNLNKVFNNEDDVKNFLKKSIKFTYKMEIGKTSSTSSSPPTPLNTSKLLQIAGNRLNFSPKQTMLLCQKLYQAGYITYMRTESTKYAGAFLTTMKTHITNTYGEKYVGDLKKIENFDVNNPHEAIRVTSLLNKYVNDDSDPKTNTLYKLIYNNTIESCMGKYTGSITKILINSPENEVYYEYNNEIPSFLGWKVLKNNEKNIGDIEMGLSLYFKSIDHNNINCMEIKSDVSFKTNDYHYTEHSLINKLESLEIGRPSTYATIIDTIQERKYVEKKDIDGEKIEIIEYRLENNKIFEKITEKVVGNEKNKLIITNLGILTLEFLCQHFNEIFSYEYTKIMESYLDKIANGEEKIWYSVCENCNNDIKEKSKIIKNIEKCVFNIDEGYEVIFERYGPCLRKKNNENKYDYYNIKSEIDINLNDLRKNNYKFNELIQENDSFLGTYNNNKIYKKNGIYGPYIEYNEKNISLKKIKKSFEDINLEDVIEIINKEKDSNILRELTPYLSIRKGKFGTYAFYKRENMKKPKFFNIKKFKLNSLECEKETFIEWLNSNYNTKNEDFV